jgi:hypothetical protein
LAARKKLTMREALSNGHWMRGLQNITSEEQLNQFVALWETLQQVNLQTENEDTIKWILTTDGKYSAKSAYDVQFLGRIHLPHLQCVWRIRAEGKVQTFLWLLLQNRKWTAERLRARGLPHDDRFCLCDQEFETAKHLALQCPYAKEVWMQFMVTHPRAVRAAASSNIVCEWWNKIRRGKMDEHRRKDISLSVYIIWHIWKERGRQIFQAESMTPNVLAGLIRDDIELLNLAKGSVVDS